MARRLIACVAALLLCAPAMPSGQAHGAWFGTWRLNPGKSSERSTPSPYKRVTLRIEPGADGLSVIYDMVGTRGGVTHLEWTGRFDGRDYPVQGSDAAITNAYRLTGDRSYDIIVKVDGAVAATVAVEISADGRTMTVDTNERGREGKTVRTTAVYDRAER